MKNEEPTIAKVFKSGNSNAIRIPSEFELDAEEYYIEDFGNGGYYLKPIEKLD